MNCKIIRRFFNKYNNKNFILNKIFKKPFKKLVYNKFDKKKKKKYKQTFIKSNFKYSFLKFKNNSKLIKVTKEKWFLLYSSLVKNFKLFLNLRNKFGFKYKNLFKVLIKRFLLNLNFDKIELSNLKDFIHMLYNFLFKKLVVRLKYKFFKNAFYYRFRKFWNEAYSFFLKYFNYLKFCDDERKVMSDYLKTKFKTKIEKVKHGLLIVNKIFLFLNKNIIKLKDISDSKRPYFDFFFLFFINQSKLKYIYFKKNNISLSEFNFDYFIIKKNNISLSEFNFDYIFNINKYNQNYLMLKNKIMIIIDAEGILNINKYNQNYLKLKNKIMIIIDAIKTYKIFFLRIFIFMYISIYILLKYIYNVIVFFKKNIYYLEYLNYLFLNFNFNINNLDILNKFYLFKYFNSLNKVFFYNVINFLWFHRNKKIFFYDNYFFKKYFERVYKFNEKFLRHRNIIIYGFKMHFSGRFSKKQRSSSIWLKEGYVPLNSFDYFIEFSNTFITLNNSLCNFKFWLVKSHFLPVTSYTMYISD